MRVNDILIEFWIWKGLIIKCFLLYEVLLGEVVVKFDL